MKFKVNLNWHICKPNKFRMLFDYKTKPKKEKNFNIKGKYNRSFYQCDLCNHICAYHDFKTNNLYDEDYLNLTYKDVRGISKRFEQIINLPILKSDNKNRAKRIDKFLGKKSSILDIGCGTGVFLHEMKIKGHSVNGLDLDERYANFLSGKKIKVFAKELKKIKIKKRFNLITFNKVLEHIQDPLQQLKYAKKFLTKDGIVYIEVPDELAKKKSKFAGEFCLDHLQIFSINSLDQLAKSAGLTTIKIKRIIEPSNKFTIFGFFRK
jgi:2-polyprenyl-3-methyl-5-hydroxy-6-metoxy-1,4-benzoquinol methylase